MTDLINKLESAAAAIVATITFSEPQTILTGENDGDVAVPNVTCSAASTEEQVPKNSGNFIVRLVISKNSNPADTGLTNHVADCALLGDQFIATDIGSQLTAAGTGLMVADPPKEISVDRDITDERLTNKISLDLLCWLTE